MKRLYEGKTKDVHALEDGNILLTFKDDATGTDGVFDPGANQKGLRIPGMGLNCLRLTCYFFEKITAAGIPTHLISADYENNTMTVLPATMFGKGIEVICRFKAAGSFLRRYGLYAAEGQALGGLVEVTLKDDARNDPVITKDALAVLGILTNDEYDELVSLTRKISNLVKDELAGKGLDMYDIKLEFGRCSSGGIMLIDEISAGSMRACKNGRPAEPLELARLLLPVE
jgi:phosphoribosylaminoimidazole-succinocarboxamide synthase